MSVIYKEIKDEVDLPSGEISVINRLRCSDKDGDSFDVDIHDEYVELIAHSETGCIVLSPEQAVELANKILAEVKL